MQLFEVQHWYADQSPDMDSGKAFFECVATATQYAQQQYQRGKHVMSRLVSFQNGYHVVRLVDVRSAQHVCHYCLQHGYTCNLVTLKARQMLESGVEYVHILPTVSS